MNTGSPLFTVVVPTHDHGPLLKHSLGSVLDQTLSDFELFVVGDGVPPSSREILVEMIKRDQRIKFFDFDKGPRLGEIHRQQVLKVARGKYVVYLSDDDLYMPNHLEQTLETFKRGNFVHAPGAHVYPDGLIVVAPVDLSDHHAQQLLLSGVSLVALSFVGHTKELYDNLPYGWRTTPAGIYTDHYMWQQFISHPDCRVASSTLPTALKFPDPAWKTLDPDARYSELGGWLTRTRSSGFQEYLIRQSLDSALRLGARKFVSDFMTLQHSLALAQSELQHLQATIGSLEEELRQHKNSKLRRLQNRLSLIPVVGRICKS